MKSLGPTTFITAGNIASTFTSSSVDVQSLDRIGMLLTWTTSAVNAVINIQASVDGITYGNLTDASGTAIATTIAASNGSQVYDIDVHAFKSLQVLVTPSSGTPGTIDGKYRASWDGISGS